MDATNQPAKSTAPAVGATFNFKGSSYRVDGWICVREPRQPTGVAFMDKFLEQLEAEDLAENGPQVKYRWCTRVEASHVAGAGICGCIAPIAEIEVTGMVSWSAEHLEEQTHFAESLGAAKELIQ